MQTTLRIDDAIYREAKAAAAIEGVSMTRFIESALKLRIGMASRTGSELPVFDSGLRVDHDVLALIAEADQERSKTDLQSLQDQF